MCDIVLSHPTGIERPEPSAHHRDRGSPADAELLNAVARGDESARAQVYDQHHACVYGLAAELYGADQARRVTAEIFSALWSASGVVDITESTLCTVLLVATRDRQFAGASAGS
jgi:hypothetical protein